MADAAEHLRIEERGRSFTRVVALWGQERLRKNEE